MSEIVSQPALVDSQLRITESPPAAIKRELSASKLLHLLTQQRANAMNESGVGLTAPPEPVSTAAANDNGLAASEEFDFVAVSPLAAARSTDTATPKSVNPCRPPQLPIMALTPTTPIDCKAVSDDGSATPRKQPQPQQFTKSTGATTTPPSMSTTPAVRRRLLSFLPPLSPSAPVPSSTFVRESEVQARSPLMRDTDWEFDGAFTSRTNANPASDDSLPPTQAPPQIAQQTELIVTPNDIICRASRKWSQLPVCEAAGPPEINCCGCCSQVRTKLLIGLLIALLLAIPLGFAIGSFIGRRMQATPPQSNLNGTAARQPQALAFSKEDPAVLSAMSVKLEKITVAVNAIRASNAMTNAKIDQLKHHIKQLDDTVTAANGILRATNPSADLLDRVHAEEDDSDDDDADAVGDESDDESEEESTTDETIETEMKPKSRVVRQPIPADATADVYVANHTRNEKNSEAAKFWMHLFEQKLKVPQPIARAYADELARERLDSSHVRELNCTRLQPLGVSIGHCKSFEAFTQRIQ